MVFLYHKLQNAAAICAFVLLAWAPASLGQTVAPGEIRVVSAPYSLPVTTLSVQSNLVELAVVVRNREGEAKGGFHISDFELFDNGKPQPISFFSEENGGRSPASSSVQTTAASPASAAPERYIALFFDDTHSEFSHLAWSKAAAEKLIAAGLEPGEHIGIFTDSGTVTEDFTTDTKVLLAALARLRPHLPPGTHGLSTCPPLDPYQAYVITYHLDQEERDRAVLAAKGCVCSEGMDPATCNMIAESHVMDLAPTLWNQLKYQSTGALDVLNLVIRHLAKAPGTRVLLLVSPGFVSGGMEQQREHIVNTALRARIVINSLDAAGLRLAGGARQGIVSELMSSASAATGGRFIHDSNDLAGGIRSLAAVPEVSYLLGFSPPGNPDGKYHSLKVRIKNNDGYRVESRAGYFAAPLAAEDQPIQQRIDRQVLSKTTIDEMPASVRVASAHSSDGRPTIRVDIDVDAKRLKFGERANRHIQELTFVTALEDAQGKFISGEQAVMDLALTPKTFDDLRRKGITASISFRVLPGSYQIREVVREVVQNHFSASTTPIAVH